MLVIAAHYRSTSFTVAIPSTYGKLDFSTCVRDDASKLVRVIHSYVDVERCAVISDEDNDKQVLVSITLRNSSVDRAVEIVEQAIGKLLNYEPPRTLTIEEALEKVAQAAGEADATETPNHRSVLAGLSAMAQGVLEHHRSKAQTR